MSQSTPRNRYIATTKIVAIYAVFGLLWIYWSDTLLGLLVRNPEIMVKIAVIKGSLFILCTAGLLFVLINRFAARLTSSEDARVESLRNYAAIFNATNEAIFVHDTSDGRIIDVNNRMLEMYGYDRSEALTINIGMISEGHPPFTQHEALRKIRLAVTEGPQVFEWLCRSKSGELFWTEVSLKRITETGYDRIIAVVRDISERKQAEKALRESNDRMLSLVNSGPGHIAFVNADSLKYEFVNDAFERSFGLPREQIMGSYVKDIIGPDNFDFALKYINEARSGKIVSYENTFNLTSGRRWIQVNYHPVIDENGHTTSIVVHSFDITDRKEHELERLKLEKMESLGVLAGGIAHDFNNVLTGIMGNISLAKEFLDESHKSFKPLSAAERASVRATELARQLLTFAKGGEPIKRIVSLQNIINESVSLVLHGSNVRSMVHITDTLHAVEADEGQLSQVINNLVINAMQAMPMGGTVTIQGENIVFDTKNALSLEPGPYVCITISDEGAGISEADISRIFDPYFTTKAKGSGLGLASAHSIINRHKGHIGVSSTIGKGSTFTIYLPSVGKPFSDSWPQPAGSRPLTLKGGTILVMDDEKIILELATAILQELGYKVVTAENGGDTIDQYRKAKESATPYTAVIMDLTIPGGMGGMETAKEILKLDQQACLIVSSGYSNDPILSQYNSYGFTAAIAKPYRIAELRKLLCSLNL